MTNRAPAPAPDQSWRYRHPVHSGLAIFAVLYLPLAFIGILKSDWYLVIGMLPGALLMGAGWSALYRWAGTNSLGKNVRGEVVVEQAETVPDVVSSEADRVWAQVAQLGVFGCPVVVAAAIFVAHLRNPFVRGWAAQAINVQLLEMVAFIGFGFVGLASGFSGIAFYAMYAAGLVVYLYVLGASLVGTVKAANGIVWRYPFTIPLVR